MGHDGEARATERPRDERALVERLLAGDETAFEAFTEAHLPPLYRFALAHLDGDRELSRDIVQTTLAKALDKLAGYRGEAPLSTWLTACCRNEIAMYFRRQRSRPRLVALEEGAGLPEERAGGSSAGAQESRLLRREEARMVHVALDLLPPRYARALEWKYVDRIPVKEIARRLDLSPKAAESLLTRARHAFRERYEGLTRSGGPHGALQRETQGAAP